MKLPPLGHYFPLDGDAVSAFCRRKGARLLTDSIVTIREHLTTATTVVGLVVGDSGGQYLCRVLVKQSPWMGYCPHGGVHDIQPMGEPCSHPLALAAKWAVVGGLFVPETGELRAVSA